jgi:transcription-repair coupling factor (superfamily II helicase)
LPAEPSFSSKLGDLATLTLPAAPDPDLLDPLPSLDPPADRRLVRAREIASSLAPRARTHVAGVTGCATALIAHELQQQRKGPVLCVAESGEAAQRLAADLAFLIGAGEPGSGVGEVLLLPPYENTPYAEVNPDRRAMQGRLATLAHIALGRPFRFLVVASCSLVRKVLPPAFLAAQTRRLEVESECERDDVARTLIQGGYLRAPVVEDPGSFALRGALLDVWPPSSSEPIRIEFYGDLILSMKTFEPESQRTLRELPEILLSPVREAVSTEATAARVKEQIHDLCDAHAWPTSKARALFEDVLSGRPFFGSDGYLPAFTELTSLLDYLPPEVPFVLEDPAALIRSLRDELGHAMADEEHKLSSPHFPRDAFYFAEFELAERLDQHPLLCLHRGAVAGPENAEDLEALEATPLDAPTLDARTHEDLERASRQARKERGKTGTLEPLVRRIHAWFDAGYLVLLSARAETQAERLTALLRHAEVPCRNRVGKFEPSWLQEPSARGVVQIVVGPLSRGAVLPGEGVVFVTEEEIFGSRGHRAARRERKGKDKAKAFLEDLRALEVGDHVVHSEHGIGRYLGLVHRQVNGFTVDLLAVEYSGGKLYLPVYRLNQIQKYSGGDGAPRLDKLGGSTFAKTKAKAEKQARQMADELLRLYAERQAIAGHALPEADDDYATFEATFPFDETPDQARAIRDVLDDLESARPMDRLVCGDVGFGKTEVAIRAAFRVAMAGRQVAVLCPTTVLAQQHFLNIQARFRDYPLRVGALSRFQTGTETSAVMRQIKEGSLDVVVGTHRLLSKDIHFKNLGLLVVDEEQRFGVTHKERIKQLRRNIDVLTLSATPIPRTLQMAVSGIRDMSLITTAPVDRRAIRTIVTRFDDQVIREAVRREMSRGGQVFYVYNRVESLYERAAKLQQLVPEARVVVAHGQMSEVALEQAMLDFVEGKFDILCATAIIESGLDIPRANTILIDRADLFGLAQLYQLRGRVGRSRERAYCYLIVPPASAMTDESRARIEALERHTELGSGFQIASLDLELRGGGDLLGADQSGTAASVGFDLFCHMLQDAVRQVRGEDVVADVEPDLNFDVEALLPEQYIDEVGVRLSLYKRLASAEDEAEVQEIAAEMEDRFGPPPREAKNLVVQMRIKAELRRLRGLGCDATARSVTLHLRQDTPLDPAKVMALIQKKGSPYRMTPDMKLSRRFADEQGDGLQNAELVLRDLAACLRDDA